MSERCNQMKSNGDQCRARAVKSGLCALHANPELASKLGRRSGQARRYADREDPNLVVSPPRTAAELTSALSDIFADIRNRRLDPCVGRTLAQLSAAIFKGIEISDLEERITKLEAKNAI
jgi:hypothetical protein